jgi:hypothetical protein
MAGSRAEKSAIPDRRDPLASVSYTQPRPPIDNLINNTLVEIRSAPEKPKQPVSEPDTDVTKQAKGKVTVLVPMDLLERLRNAAWWQRKTLAGLAEEGIRQIVEKLERQHGGPFEPREEELKTGRPQGSKTSSTRAR